MSQNRNNIILLSHGSGGKLTQDLIKNLFVKYFDNEILLKQTDSAILKIKPKNIAFTTDSYVVNPIFFKGGDIGKLAICGTINDLAVSGAIPKYISTSFIIEEGLRLIDLERIVKSIAEEAKIAGVKIVTGDTKVVEKGKCDKIYINTSGIGEIKKKHRHISFGKNIKVGDKIIINGSIGDHASTILVERNKIDSHIKSDCASLNKLIQNLLSESLSIKFMRDVTRGGLANVLCETVENKSFGVNLDENCIPIKNEVKGLCEVFGFDPLYMANEGKVIIIVDKNEAEKALKIMKNCKEGLDSSIIGEVTKKNNAEVIFKTEIGGSRIIRKIVGDQLPRIC